jgi:hypothetical protein
MNWRRRLLLVTVLSAGLILGVALMTFYTPCAADALDPRAVWLSGDVALCSVSRTVAWDALALGLGLVMIVAVVGLLLWVGVRAGLPRAGTGLAVSALVGLLSQGAAFLELPAYRRRAATTSSAPTMNRHRRLRSRSTTSR